MIYHKLEVLIGCLQKVHVYARYISLRGSKAWKQRLYTIHKHKEMFGTEVRLWKYGLRDSY